ncbi:kinase-like domain-containing protein [Aspergillus varians]
MSSDPCTACSWAAERQKHRGYESRVKIFYEAGDRGVWSLGSKLIVKDRGPSIPALEVPNIQFVQEQTSIPVPTVVDSWDEDGHALIVMRRVPGKPLSEDWPTLHNRKREYRKANRRVYCNFLIMNGKPGNKLHGPLATDEELWEEMEQGLIENGVPEAARIRLRKSIPPSKPYTFTHGDLASVNMMVENGSLTDIIDWEMSGFFPVWWEYASTSVGQGEEDWDWKDLLRKYIPDYSDVREFWRNYFFLCRDLKSERAAKFIEETELERVRMSLLQ